MDKRSIIATRELAGGKERKVSDASGKSKPDSVGCTLSAFLARPCSEVFSKNPVSEIIDWTKKGGEGIID